MNEACACGGVETSLPGDWHEVWCRIAVEDDAETEVDMAAAVAEAERIIGEESA